MCITLSLTPHGLYCTESECVHCASIGCSSPLFLRIIKCSVRIGRQPVCRGGNVAEKCSKSERLELLQSHGKSKLTSETKVRLLVRVAFRYLVPGNHRATPKHKHILLNSTSNTTLWRRKEPGYNTSYPVVPPVRGRENIGMRNRSMQPLANSGTTKD
jgi:hypothetical protein